MFRCGVEGIHGNETQPGNGCGDSDTTSAFLHSRQKGLEAVEYSVKIYTHDFAVRVKRHGFNRLVWLTRSGRHDSGIEVGKIRRA